VISFWLPSIVKGFGVSNSVNGWISAIPYTVGFVGMIWWGLRSDAKMERIGHLTATLAITAIGIGASGFLDDPYLKMIALTVGAFGVFGSLPLFWTLPTAILGSTTAAAGIAAINSIGNLSGYFGPFAMGYIKDATGSFAWGLALVAGLAVIALIIALALGHDHSLEKAPPEGARTLL
jgi:MFS transporter, ACS family, tartrate transporter